MSDLLKFLTRAKQNSNEISLMVLENKSNLRNCMGKRNKIHLVLGNEACDMDSTISSIVLAYGLQMINLDTLTIPILNVKRKEFPLRTETYHLLKEHKITLESLIFKDDISYLKDLIKRHQRNEILLSISVVDHHVLAENDKLFNDYVTQIFDHRPINANEKIKHDDSCKKIEEFIEPVGSCSTLIAEYLLIKKELDLSPTMIDLIYATIIFDTIALNEECGRTTKKDEQIAQLLEKMNEIDDKDRQKRFDILWRIHNDITGIEPKDLLYRDAKKVENVIMPGIPLLVRDYLQLPRIPEVLKSFLAEFDDVTAIVLTGIHADGTVSRDIGVYGKKHDEFLNLLLKTLKDNEELQLEQDETVIQIDDITYFKQRNTKLTRKFILPLVIKAIKSHNSK